MQREQNFKRQPSVNQNQIRVRQTWFTSLSTANGVHNTKSSFVIIKKSYLFYIFLVLIKIV